MHIKHRPNNFDEVLGQDHIIQGLKTLDFAGRAILFEGIKGTGKTTLALILANMFSNEKENIFHINCGHTSTVAEMREYVNEFHKSTLFGRKKTYIMDEPQLLSYKAINELLIPFENLPENVFVILCSAESEKIEPMLLDRTLRFRTKSLDDKMSLKFVNDVCKKEGVKLSKYTKALIVEKSDGIPRKMLTAIPKIVNIEDEDDIKYLLEVNAIDEDEDILLLFKMLLARKNWNEIKGYLNKLLKNKSPETIRVGLMNLIGHNLLSHYMGDILYLTDAFDILSRNNFPEKASLVVALSKIVKNRR